MVTARGMSGLTLAQALGRARETRRVEAGSGILPAVPRVFRELFGAQAALIVADTTTLAVAGQGVEEAFRHAGHALLPTFVFRDPDLYAEHRFVERLAVEFGRHHGVPVAVGSGTINDLVKLAAHRVGRPYLCVATAASMDGYTAFGASLTHRGSKQTFSCPAPAGVVADLDIIARAPGDMTASGYADLLAKVPAGADWILADALGLEPIDPEAWRIVQGSLPAALNDPAGVRQGQPAAVQRLIEGLLMGGFAMQSMQSSRPASGAEHQFSHLWDMQHHTHNGVAPSHGFKVGVGTLASAALYEFLLQQPLESLDVGRCCAAWPAEDAIKAAIRRSFDLADLTAKALEETKAKYVPPAGLGARLERLRAVWPELRRRLREQLVPVPELRRMLHVAGAPCEPEQIGISRRRLRASYRQAYFIRRRYTVLDLAVEAGLLDAALDAVFGPAGVWPDGGGATVSA